MLVSRGSGVDLREETIESMSCCMRDPDWLSRVGPLRGAEPHLQIRPDSQFTHRQLTAWLLYKCTSMKEFKIERLCIMRQTYLMPGNTLSELWAPTDAYGDNQRG